MVKVSFDPPFRKTFSKIKNGATKRKLINQFRKIRANPKVGKPMKFTRKGTREVYVTPYRLSYFYIKEENKIVFLDL